MDADQIAVGKVYIIKHFGDLVRVRVDKIEQKETYSGFDPYSNQPKYRNLTRYRCTKLSTGRKIDVKSARKFKREATELGRVALAPVVEETA